MGDKTPPGPRWSRLGPEQRREQILKVAHDHFARQNFDAVSTAEIADEAGVNRGLIYHYFGTKRDLYLEVLKGAMKVPSLPKLEVLALEGNLEVEFAHEVDDWLGDVAENREVFLAAAGPVGTFGRDPEVEGIMRDVRERTARMFIGRVSLEPDVSEAMLGAVMALGGLVQAATVEWLDGERLSRDQVRELIVVSTMNLLANTERILGAEPLAQESREVG